MATSINFPSGPTSGDTYTYGNVTYIWDGTRWHLEANYNALSGLTDTNLSATTNGYVLTYSSAASKWIASGSTGGGTSTLSGLTDVDTTGAISGDTLVYNSATSKWEAQASTSGISPNSIGITELKPELKAVGSTSYIANGFGEAIYTTPGTYTFTATTNSISVVCIGGGGGGASYNNYVTGGCGGGLGWKNNIPVVSGNTYTVVVGSGGTRDTLTSTTDTAQNGGDSYFSSTTLVCGFGGPAGKYNTVFTAGGLFSGDSGGIGGYPEGAGTSHLYAKGGGGAGGYTGNGGNSPAGASSSANVTSGGGGAAGGNSGSSDTSGGGGGVGLFGQGANGIGGVYNGVDGTGGGGGSGGATGGVFNSATGATGGLYGGGGGASSVPNTTENGHGGSGAVRIIWGFGASFPSSGATSGATNVINIDWSLGIQFEYTMTGDTGFMFTNYVLGKTITLKITGNYVATFGFGVDVLDLAAFDGTKTNYIQIYCVDATTPTFLTGLIVK